MEKFIGESILEFTDKFKTDLDCFELVYKNSATLGTDVQELSGNKVIVYKQNGVLNVNSGTTIMKTVRLFDLRGRLIYEQDNINQSTTALKGFTAARQTVLVQITTKDGIIETTKVIY